jgi:hypothetical protein
MRPSGSCLGALAAIVAAPLLGCGGPTATPDGGSTTPKPADLVSDFEEGRAVVLPLGDPARTGYWYSYNDGTCLQSPAHGDSYYASAPVAVAPGLSHGRALHAAWLQCAGWGGGVGADFDAPIPDGGISTAPRVPYSVQSFAGVTFWAMAMPGTDVHVRVKMVMRASTMLTDRGTCDASLLGPNRCGDEWGEPITLPSDGSWQPVTVKFTDATFKQEGWGQPFPWNPADVLGIQFQSVDPTALYDFWVDDVMFVH